jgi:hypothetical protein
MNNHTPSRFESNDASEGRKRTTMFDTPGVKMKQFRTEEDETSLATARTEVRSVSKHSKVSASSQSHPGGTRLHGTSL